MFFSSSGYRKQTVTIPQFRRQFQIGAIWVLFNEALQALKETPDDCE